MINETSLASLREHDNKQHVFVVFVVPFQDLYGLVGKYSAAGDHHLNDHFDNVRQRARSQAAQLDRSFWWLIWMIDHLYGQNG